MMNFSPDRRIELTVCGRAGIDLNTTAVGQTFGEIPSFTKSVGGSPANIVQGAAKLGLKTGFIGKVSRDGMGEYILEVFRNRGIDTSGIVIDQTGANNCLALTEIISAEQNGAYAATGDAFHHGTYLYRGNTADTLITPADISEELIASSASIMVSGTAFSQSPSREAMFEILRLAKKHGVLTVIDLDYRPFGWKSKEETAECYERATASCDIIIGNREEFNAVEYVSMPDNRDNEKSARETLLKGASLVIVKDGARGSWGYTADKPVVRCPAIPTKAIKNFGSGDAFAAGLMFGILRKKELLYAMRLGSACASIMLTKISCSEDMPDYETAETYREAHFAEEKNEVE